MSINIFQLAQDATVPSTPTTASILFFDVLDIPTPHQKFDNIMNDPGIL
jgi:hypothetical protein